MMTSTSVNQTIPITPPVVPPVDLVTELIDTLANTVEIGGSTVVGSEKSDNCETIVKRDYHNSIIDFFDLEENDIQDLVKNYESKRNSFECIAFGLTETRCLKGLMHWVQD